MATTVNSILSILNGSQAGGMTTAEKNNLALYAGDGFAVSPGHAGAFGNTPPASSVTAAKFATVQTNLSAGTTVTATDVFALINSAAVASGVSGKQVWDIVQSGSPGATAYVTVG